MMFVRHCVGFILPQEPSECVGNVSIVVKMVSIKNPLVLGFVVAP